ncbi:hypothetical protein E4U30_005649 [Claviceps sp. LM220 group G6]|nr:hypothetical protein E4U30_005649 [Claviceps sp. LM220 group G6]
MGTTGGGKQEDVSYASFMSSKAFEFLVGPDKKPFIIHSELVASLSPVLERLVKGNMEEAQKGSVVWEHVDEQTFIRLSQYAYMRTYEYPAFRPRPQPKAGPSKASLLATDADTERDSYRYNHRSSMLKMCDDSWEAFFENEPPIPSHLTKVAMKKASPLADGERNDAELLLSHARLYVLADCYGIKPLMGLSLSTLYSVLSEFMEWDDVADMLIKLLRYCFENDTPAELREFVMRYAVCHIEDLWKRKEVIELARTHADFSSAIVEAMLYSLNW